jgi:hypothetical protein
MSDVAHVADVSLLREGVVDGSEQYLDASD